MKLRAKLLPLLMIAGVVLTGCGAHHQTVQHHRSTNETASAPRKAEVQRDLNHDRNGADHKNYQTQQQAKQGIQRQINRQPPAVRNTAQTSKAKSNSTEKTPGAVDLGHGIIGHQDRGAGQTYVSFKMGRWQIVIHGNDVNEKSSTAVNHAKNLVDYLQNHTLPIPESHGLIQIDLTDSSARMSWDQNHKVNTLNGKPDAMLQKAVALK